MVFTLEDACRVIDKYEKETIWKFIVRQVDKGFGAKGQWRVIVFLFTLFISAINIREENQSIDRFVTVTQ